MAALQIELNFTRSEEIAEKWERKKKRKWETKGGVENQRQQKDFKAAENQVVAILSAAGPSVPDTPHFLSLENSLPALPLSLSLFLPFSFSHSSPWSLSDDKEMLSATDYQPPN